MIEDVTIGVMTWNSLDMLKMFFEYLEEYTPSGYKIIVINNGSTDGTKEFLDSKKGVVSVHNKENLGVIKALQQTEELITTKYFLSINDDILVSENWLTDLLEIYESDKNIKTVAPFKPGTKIIYPYSQKSSRQEWEESQIENPDLSRSKLLNIFTKNNYNQFVRDIKKANDFGNKYLECPFGFVSGCCLLVETEFMKEIGGFVDGRFEIYGAEDIDRCWNIGLRGYDIVQTNKVFVHHFEGVSLKSNKLRWKKLVKENNARLIEKWHDVFWSLLKKKINQKRSLDAVIKENWIVQWLLESVEEENVPNSLKHEVKIFLTNNSPKLN